METNLRAQKKYERTGRIMRAVDEKIPKTRGWALLGEDDQKTTMALIRKRASEHVDSIIDDLEVGHRLDYTKIAEAGIRTAYDEKIELFIPTLPDNSKADPYTVAELMEDFH